MSWSPGSAAPEATRDRSSLPKWAFWAAILGGWTLLSVLLAPELYLHLLGRGEPIAWSQILALTFTSTAVAAVFAPVVVWFTRRFPLEREGWPRSLAVHTATCLLFSVSHSGLYWVLCYASNGTLGALLFQRFQPNLITYWAIVAFTEAHRHFERSRVRERQLVEARLELLEAQLQPHFLFNTINTIAAMMHEDVWAADRTLNRLSDLLRLALGGASRHETTLHQEIQFVEAYVEIQRARFGEGLRLTLDIDAHLWEASVPSLILQPLVENSIRHGFSSHPGRGTIEITARSEGARLRIRVTDDGKGLSAGEPGAGPGLGLANTRQRLKHLYAGEHHLSIESRPTGGTIVTVSLPLHYPGRDPSAAPELRHE